MATFRIAMIGTRGVPATFGGIERHVEEIGARLAARGHEVTVFCRRNYVADRASTHRGMQLRHLPTVGMKHFDAIVHSALSTFVALRGPFDVIHYHALGPGLLSPLPRLLSRARVVQTIHGLDHRRAKWRPGARQVLAFGAWLSERSPHATIAVSKELVEHYGARGRHAVYIPNGVPETLPRPASESLTRLGLRPGGYALFVGRMVPEKAPDLLVRAFRAVGGDVRLVLVGGSSFTKGYVSELQRLASEDSRVILAGYLYGEALEELYSNAGAFVLPSSLEGMPLTLLEAISFGAPVVASDIAPHLEVLGGDGPGRRVFRSGDEQGLTLALKDVLADPVRERAGSLALRRDVLARYRWDAVAEATERLYAELLKTPVPAPQRRVVDVTAWPEENGSAIATAAPANGSSPNGSPPSEDVRRDSSNPASAEAGR